MRWIDTHCHLDAAEFEAAGFSRTHLRQQAKQAGVICCVYPAVSTVHFAAVAELAHQTHDAYALGIHPLHVGQASVTDLQCLEQALWQRQDDPRLVAVGEIGLDFFLPELTTPTMRERQWYFYRAQLQLAQRFSLPVILHVRRAVDWILKGLRLLVGGSLAMPTGIAHAFNGSLQQAAQLCALGFKLGFGGAATFDTARQLRQLWSSLPAEALVLETDAPDMLPQWLYVAAAQRHLGQPQGLNTPFELPKIGAILAPLRQCSPTELAHLTSVNACQALPKLQGLVCEQQPLAP